MRGLPYRTLLNSRLLVVTRWGEGKGAEGGEAQAQDPGEVGRIKGLKSLLTGVPRIGSCTWRCQRNLTSGSVVGNALGSHGKPTATLSAALFPLL